MFQHHQLHSKILVDLILHVSKSLFQNWHQLILWIIWLFLFLFRFVFGEFGFSIFDYLTVNFSSLRLLYFLFSFNPNWSDCYFFEGNYLINYLASKGPELEPFVLGSLIQLFCRITKFGWLDDDKFREVVKEAMNFLSQVTQWMLKFDMEVHIFPVCFVLASSKVHQALKCAALIC